MPTDSLTAIANREGFQKSLTVVFDKNQTAGTLLTPTSGKFLQVSGVAVSTESTDGNIRIYFADDEDDNVDGVAQIYSATNPGYLPVIKRGDRNAVLKITTTLGDDDEYFVLVNYTER